MFQITVKKKPHIIQKTVALEQKKTPNNKNLKQNPNGFQVLCDRMHCHVKTCFNYVTATVMMLFYAQSLCLHGSNIYLHYCGDGNNMFPNIQS